jgi:hypothetical protein
MKARIEEASCASEPANQDGNPVQEALQSPQSERSALNAE